MHDPLLRDNQTRPPGERPARGLRAGTPYARQIQVRAKAHPDIPEKLLKPLRRLADRYGAALLGELSGDGQLERMATYTHGNAYLHFAYSFDLTNCPLTARGIREVLEPLEAEIGDGWPCWSFGNHDVMRATTRHGGEHPPRALAKLLPVLLCSLRGSVCLYQGEELGLPEADLAYEDIRDPPGLAFWPQFKGRDGARTPMPWHHDRPFAGFSTKKPWLPVPDAHRPLAVDRQESDPESALCHTRRFLRWRRHRALVVGDIRFLETPEPVLAFMRTQGADAILCAFNLGAGPTEFTASAPALPIDGHGFAAEIDGGRIVLPGYGAFFGRLQPHG